MMTWKSLYTGICVLCSLILLPSLVRAQDLSGENRTGEQVPADVERITMLAIDWLAKNQNGTGNWSSTSNESDGGGECAITGLCVMAFLSTGTDPNFGDYSHHVRAAVRNIIASQDPNSGYLPNSMYHHGFGMLALAEAYGAVDEELLWSDPDIVIPSARRRTIGQALKLAVQCAISSQNQNPWKAWRYHPTARDADSSVTGAVLVGLLAAKNAGIRVPDENIENALKYMRDVTGKNGDVNYTPGFGMGTTTNLPAIACLIYAVSKHQDWDEYAAVTKVVRNNSEIVDSSYPHYNIYYVSQALFQADFESWIRWNAFTTRRLRREQNRDGSFDSNFGKAFGTSMSVLALALNYRLLPIYER